MKETTGCLCGCISRSVQPRIQIAVALALIWLVLAYGPAEAQDTAWSQPINLSNSPNDSNLPSIVTDSAGFVHVVWCEGVESDQANTIYYTRFDGETWSPPVDIVHTSSQVADAPVLAIDPENTLHMVWVGGHNDRVLYSQAPALTADSARAWRTPVEIGDRLTITNYPDIATDDAGGLHVVYAVRGGEEAGVYYSDSPDGGRNWTLPIRVSEPFASDRIFIRARLALDEGGGIHAVWTEGGIRYAQSLDGGNTWSTLLTIDGSYDLAGILTLPENQVHLTWSGSDLDRKKFHRWSSDRGLTWTPIVALHEVGGYQGWPGLAADSRGAIHLVQVSNLQAGLKENLYYQVWQNETWSPPINLLSRVEGSPNHPTNPQLAIGLGNQLHLVVAHYVQQPAASQGWAFEIFYLRGLADAPQLEPVPVAAQVRASPSVAVLPSTATPHPATTRSTATSVEVAAPGQPPAEREPAVVVVVSIIPVLLLLGGVFVARLTRKR